MAPRTISEIDAVDGSSIGTESASVMAADEVSIESGRSSMQAVTTIGLDIAKNVFQVHGLGADGRVVFRHQLKRGRVLPFFKKLQPCTVGIEACATSHHWAREIGAFGHTVKLIPPVYVKPFVKRQKNDAADAEAIAEAMLRPSMRFVPVKTPDQQAGMVLHRTRHLVRQLTAVVNALRAHLAEFGIVAARGREGVAELIAIVRDVKDERIPAMVRSCLYAFAIQLEALSQQIAILDKRLTGLSRTDETCFTSPAGNCSASLRCHRHPHRVR